MKEYTLLAFVSAAIAVMLDKRFKTGLLKRREYYIFLLVIFCFKLLVNGYLTSNIVFYDPQFFLHIRLGTIPLEDFFFGFSMVTVAIVVWEYFKAKERSRI